MPIFVWIFPYLPKEDGFLLWKLFVIRKESHLLSQFLITLSYIFMTKFILIASVTVGLLFILTSCTTTPDSNHSMTDGSNMSGTTHTE